MSTLIVVAHMDDEALSCGGLIATRPDCRVLVVYKRRYVGESSEQEEKSMREERNDFHNALGTLGCSKYKMLNLEEGEPHQVGYYSPLVQIENYLLKHPAEEIVFPDENDLNQDHRMLSDLMQIVCRPANLLGVKKVLKSIAHDSKMTTPQYFVPMTREDMDRKLNAIACYRREARSGTHPRSPQNIEALARLHGSRCGHEYAEGYHVHMIREDLA